MQNSSGTTAGSANTGEAASDAQGTANTVGSAAPGGTQAPSPAAGAGDALPGWLTRRIHFAMPGWAIVTGVFVLLLVALD